MQRYFVKNIKNETVTFEEGDIHHIKKVMRMNIGDTIECVYNKELYKAQIYNLEPLEVKIIAKSEHSNMSKPYIIMIIPLLVEQKMDFIFQKCTELGVDEFYLYDAVRSKIKLDTTKYEKRVNRWSKLCKEASEQSHRIDIPKISGVYKLKDLKDLEGCNIICSTKKTENFKNVLKKNSNCDKINIVVGPEGGFDDKEEETFVSFNYLRASLGPNILRVETAPLCVLSYINYEFME